MAGEREITSIEDLLAGLSEDNDNYEGDIWYRGQAKSDWTLVPGYYRFEAPPSESTLLKKFKQSAAMLIDTAPKETFDWMFLMQHYGVPTRLLDWTESPLVALYFAVETSQHLEEDGALWMLKPSLLNINAHIHNRDETGYIPSFEDEELKSYSIDSLSGNRKIELLPVATIATRNNPRIQAQLGVFTIHHHDSIPIEQVGDGAHAIKYIIPANRKPIILKQLKVLGFGIFQLFPELSSIGAIIKSGVR